MNPNNEKFDKLFITMKELQGRGLSYYKIKKLVEGEKLRKLNRTYYENIQYDGNKSEFFYVPIYTPKGVICLSSAAVYWQLSTIRPTAIDVALPRDSQLYTQPKWPQFNLFYFDKTRHELGIQIINENGNSFMMYDPEKTVADILYYKEKIGIEQVKEVLTRYLSRESRDLNKLYSYASQLNTADTLRTYMEILL